MLSISAVWLSPHPARLPAVKGKSSGWGVPGAAEGLRAPGAAPGVGSSSWHSSVLGVVPAGPGDSEQAQAEEDAELFLLGCIPLQLCARSEPGTLSRNLQGAGTACCLQSMWGGPVCLGNAHFGAKRGLIQPRPSENHCFCHHFSLLGFVSLVCFSVAGLCSHLPPPTARSAVSPHISGTVGGCSEFSRSPFTHNTKQLDFNHFVENILPEKRAAG